MSKSFRNFSCLGVLILSMSWCGVGYAQQPSNQHPTTNPSYHNEEAGRHEWYREEMTRLHAEEENLKKEREKLQVEMRRLHEQEEALHQKMRALHEKKEAEHREWEQRRQK